jgi:hypothetical protein
MTPPSGGATAPGTASRRSARAFAPWRLARALLVQGALLLAMLAAAAPVRAAYMVPGTPVRPKDFAIVKDASGTFHVFYILNTAGLQNTANEVELGHATSPDLYHWTQQPRILHTVDWSWDNSHIWAPSIVYCDSLWWMFFTGTTRLPYQYEDTQRMGLAVSSDLYDWSRFETPIFAAPQVSWTWDDSLSSIPAFRDPCVIPDPSTPGSWLMYYTASYGPDSLADVVGVARSAGDFTQWNDVGPLLITWRGYTFNQVTESPSIFFHNGLWYLVISTSAGQSLTLYTATDPLAGPSGWNYRGRIRNMLGYDTSTWFASEYFRDGTHDLFAFATGDRLEFREIEWGDGWGFMLVDPPYFHVEGLDWVANTVTTADTAQLVVRATNYAAGPPHLRTFLVDSLGGETECPPESVGVDPYPVLTSAADTLQWTPRRWPRVRDWDTLSVTRLRIRTSDSTAVSSVLEVHGGHYSGLGDPGDPPPNNDPPKKPVLRTISRSAIEGDPAAVVLLAESAYARVDVYDVSGRRIRNLAAGELARGATVLAWDGRDDNGVRQRHGIYFARLVTGGQVRTGRLLLLGS